MVNEVYEALGELHTLINILKNVEKCLYIFERQENSLNNL